MKTKVAPHTTNHWVKSLGMMATRTPEEVAAFAGPNEAYVLRAVNSHEELLSALKWAMREIQQSCDLPGEDGMTVAPDSILRVFLVKVEKTIAKAEGRS